MFCVLMGFQGMKLLNIWLFSVLFDFCFLCSVGFYPPLLSLVLCVYVTLTNTHTLTHRYTCTCVQAHACTHKNSYEFDGDMCFCSKAFLCEGCHEDNQQTTEHTHTHTHMHARTQMHMNLVVIFVCFKPFSSFSRDIFKTTSILLNSKSILKSFSAFFFCFI